MPIKMSFIAPVTCDASNVMRRHNDENVFRMPAEKARHEKANKNAVVRVSIVNRTEEIFAIANKADPKSLTHFHGNF